MNPKKTTTKKTVKKAIGKAMVKPKSVLKEEKITVSKKVNENKKLVSATGANCFWVHNGPILKDLLELEKALDSMTDKVFAHHVSGKRNDFADWIEAVLKDSETALAFKKAKKPKTARTIIVKQLKFYKLPNPK